MRKVVSILANIIAIIGLSAVPAASAFAWGPERETFINELPAEYPTFNSITDNGLIGDERDFVRILELDSSTDEWIRDYDFDFNNFVNEVNISKHKYYAVFIYYHNDAQTILNGAEHDYKGLATGVKLKATYPHSLKAGERAAITARIEAENTTPSAVWDEAYLTATEDIKLEVVEGSTLVHNNFLENSVGRISNLFDDRGIYLGVTEPNGVVPGCSQFAGYITYILKASELDADNSSGTTNTDAPIELPNTGARLTAILLVVLVVSLLAIMVIMLESSTKVREFCYSTRALFGKIVGKFKK